MALQRCISMSDQVVEQTGCLPHQAIEALEKSHNDVRIAVLNINSLRSRALSTYSTNLEALWQEYAGKATHTDVDGTIRIFEDLEVPLESEVTLAIAYQLQAPEMGVIEKQGYINGWADLRCDSISAMRTATHTLQNSMLTAPDYFAHVYRFCFKFNLPSGQRLLPLGTAIAYWQLLLQPRYPIVDKWIAFMQTQDSNVSRDVWNMFLVFCQYLEADPSLGDYDESHAWPMLIDSFVEALPSLG